MGDSLDASRPNWLGSGAQRHPSASLTEISRVNTLGLDNTRPNWQNSQHEQGAPIYNAPGITTQLDASRPQPNLSLHPSATSELNTSTAAQKQASDDQQRIVDDLPERPAHARPMDFLKLVSLWTTVTLPENLQREFVLEAAISQGASKTLGRGLSFDVVLIRFTPPRALQPVRGGFVVYKMLRGLSDQLDPIEKGELLRAALLEVRVLTHPPLRNHPNIIGFLQLVWEPDPDHIDQAWPVIMLEHAEHGTLADFQETYPDISYSFKKQLSLDVGKGLLALHACGIVHGDLKSENVLVCEADSADGKVVAKLADFGCAVADLEPSETMKLPAFTFPWNAPECHDRLPRDLLKYSDVYSYGLLVWRVMLNGANPFRCIDSLASLDKMDLQREVEKFKMEDCLPALARLSLCQPFCKPDVQVDTVLGVLEMTLRLDAVSRDLHGAVTRLNDPIPIPGYPSEFLVPYNYEDIQITLPLMYMTPMCLQISVARELEALSSAPGQVGLIACLQLFELYMARLEWPDGRESAAKWYLETCKKGIENNLTYGLTRYAEYIFEHLGLPVPAGIDSMSGLKACAADGCYDSLMKLKRRSEAEYQYVLRYYRRHGGIMSREKKRAILEWLPFDDFDGSLENLLAERKVNMSTAASENGDTLLHAAARFGCVSAIERLLSMGARIDAGNNDNETALFQACRAGNFEAVELLINKGANAVISANNGETALHWMFTFNEEDTERAIELLISQGAEPCFFSTVEHGRSSATHHIPFYGTPLHYAVLAKSDAAVSALLRKGADPFFEYQDEVTTGAFRLTPFRIAVIYVLPSILKAMMSESSPALMQKLKEYLEHNKTTFLRTAMASFGQVLATRCTLGRERVRALIETIDFLRTLESTDDIFMELIIQRGVSLLHACILYGLPVEVTEHLLKTGCQKDMERVAEIREHTPLQAAIYLNRRETFQLLLRYGADIHRKLHFPRGYSYLQYCSIMGPHAEYFVRELISRGVVPEKMPDAKIFRTEAATFAPPGIRALMTGNFALATFFANIEASGYIVPRGAPIVSFLLGIQSRLPVSRLRYLLEPPEGFKPAELNDDAERKANCFHTLALNKGARELETIVNFRYLLAQSKARGMHQQLLNQLDKFSSTPLTAAAMSGQLELVREMLYAGADPNVEGFVTCGNAAHLGLQRLRKARNQPLNPQQGVTLTAREARWAEEDLKSIVLLTRQFGGEEPATTAGRPKMNISKVLAADGFKVIRDLGKGYLDISYHRYQAEQARRTRFAGDGEQAALQSVIGTPADRQSSNSFPSSSLSESSSGFKGKIENAKSFAKWLLRPGKEIQPSQGPVIRPLGRRNDQTSTQVHNRGAQPAIPGAAPDGVTPSQHPQKSNAVPIRSSAAVIPRTSGPLAPQHSQSHIYPQQQQNAQKSEAHLQNLAFQLPSILSRNYADPTQMHSTIQHFFDVYFIQSGASALPPDGDDDSTAPLGSSSVLEIESGINSIFQNRGVLGGSVVLKRSDGWLKVTVSAYPYEPISAIEQRARACVGDGWFGWRELEEKEAEILSRRFEEMLSVDATE